MGRQGPGISVEIETLPLHHNRRVLPGVARGLASRLRLKLGEDITEHCPDRGRQGPGISVEIETTNSIT